MLKVVLDTNVLLDLFGASSEADALQAKALVAELARHSETPICTPAILKDFAYLYPLRLKSVIRAEKGSFDESDAACVAQCASAAVASLMELCAVASEGMVDCEMARLMCKQHADFEDNVIAAVARRIDADYIVTRDERFMRHCPIACLSPADMVAHLQAGTA